MNRRRNENGQFSDGGPKAIGFGFLLPFLRGILSLFFILLICFPWIYIAWNYLKPIEFIHELIKESIMREGKNLTCFAYKNGYDLCN